MKKAVGKKETEETTLHPEVVDALKKLNDTDILPANRKMILEFIEHKTKRAKRKVKFRRCAFLLNILRRYAMALGKTSFKKASQDDLLKAVDEVTAGAKKTATYNLRIFDLKDFYMWLFDDDAAIKKLFSNKRIPTKALGARYYDRRGQILTWQEVVMLSQATKKLRDRALIQFLAASGCRIGEAIHMQIKDIKIFDNGEVQFSVNQKADWEPKTVQGIRTCSLPRAPLPQSGADRLLIDYLSTHPARNDPEAPLFYGLKGRRMRGSGVNAMLRRTNEIVKLKKPLHCHVFRHHSFSVKAAYLTDQHNKAYHGQSQNSNCLVNYVHTDEGTLRTTMTGGNKKAEPSYGEIQCAKCRHINAPGLLFCFECGTSLNTKEKLLMEAMALIAETVAEKSKEQNVKEHQIWNAAMAAAPSSA